MTAPARSSTAFVFVRLDVPGDFLRTLGIVSSKISHDCTLTPRSKFERRYGKSNDNLAFTNLRVLASHVQKAVYSGELFAAFAAVCACSMLTVIVPLLGKIDSSAVSPEVL